MEKLPISVIILTLNEEDFIDRCVSRLTEWAGEVLVVNSGSKDKTVEVATARGARVVHQPWLGWVGQRHAGMDAATYDWCFIVEADEVVDDRLIASIREAFSTPPDPTTCFSLERVEEFCGVLLPNTRREKKRANFIRLMNKQKTRYDTSMLIHEEVMINGEVRWLEGALLHWRNFTLQERFAQDNHNATLEARMMQKSGKTPSLMRSLSMPFLRFLWLYVRCGLWKTGRHGLFYSLSCSMREIMREAKLWELTSVEQLRHPPNWMYVATPSGADWRNAPMQRARALQQSHDRPLVLGNGEMST